MDRLSPESLAKVEKAHPNFDVEVKNKLDVIELWKLITKVHANGNSY